MNMETGRVRRFLSRSMIVRLATVSARQQPRLTPLWFVADRGRIYMNAREGSPAARDIAAHAGVVLLFSLDRGPDNGSVLRITGRARVRRRAAVRRRAVLLSALKYHISRGGLRNLLGSLGSLFTRLHYYAERGGEAAAIEVVPERAEIIEAPA
jgi:uncharacterized pyridoxamine 5'-phosphate oxidase family protein